MSLQRVFNRLMLILLLGSQVGCRSSQELPPAYLLTANMHDKCMEVLREGLHSNEFWPSVIASEGLIRAGYGFEAMSVLEKKLEQETGDVYRTGLARALVRSGNRNGVVLLQDILLSGDQTAKIEAVKSMFYVADVADESLLREVYNESRNDALHIYTAGVLALTRGESTLDEVRQGLKSSDPAVRIAAADIIPVLGTSERDTTQLISNLDQSNTDLETIYLLRALSILDHTPSQVKLTRLLRHEDPTIRAKAVASVAEAWMVYLSEHIFSSLDDPSLEVRVQAAQTLLTLNDPLSPFRYIHIKE